MLDTVDAIISLHRGYADAVFAGTKTVELRRKFPKLPSGTRLWIYATRPTGAVMGFVSIQDMDRGPPATIWKTHGTSVGIDQAAFNEYFDGASEAIAIRLTAACRVSPIAMGELRQIRKHFHPPQILTRLTALETKELRELIQK